MLQSIKDRASGWVAYVIVALLALVFALWGIQSYFGSGDPRVAATVDGDEIPLQAFNRQLQQQRSRLAQLNEGSLPTGLQDTALKASVIQGLVLNRVVAQEVQAAGYQVGDRLVFERIQEIPAFQTEGRFDPELYSRILATQGLAEPGFEQSLREEIRQSQFVDGVRQTAFVTQAQRQDYVRLEHQQRDLAWFVIPADTAAARSGIGAEAVAAYYEAQQAQFKTSERVKLAYVALDRDALAKRIEPDEAALRAHYRSQLDRYTEPEQRRARHILIQVPAGADEAAVAEARAQAEELSARLAEGETFAVLAEQHSEDTLSAESGGDLGFVIRGDMGERFEEVLFSLEEGEISEPIRTELGFQIVKLEAIRPAEQQPFEAVRGEVLKDYRARRADRRLAELTDTLLTVSYEQPDSLEPTADALGVDVKTTSWLTAQAGEGIAGNTAVRRAAFSEDVLERGRNSDLIELPDGRVAVVRVMAHEPAKPQSLASVRESIVAILTAQNARDQADAAGEAALARLREGASFQEIAADYGDIEAPGFVGRNDRQVPGPVLAAAFSAGRPDPSDAVYRGVQLADGYAVLAVRGVRPGDEAGVAAAAGGEAQQAVNYGSRELDAVFQALRNQADIEIREENL